MNLVLLLINYYKNEYLLNLSNCPTIEEFFLIYFYVILNKSAFLSYIIKQEYLLANLHINIYMSDLLKIPVKQGYLLFYYNLDQAHSDSLNYPIISES